MFRRPWGGQHRLWLYLAALLLSLLPAGVAAECDGRVYGTGGDGVSLREAPAPDAPRLMVLPEGTPVKLLEGPKRAGGEAYWARVEAEGLAGWMVAEYLLMDGSPPPVTTPLTAPVPAPAPPAPPASPAQLEPGGRGQVTGTAEAGGLRLRTGPAPWENLLAIIPEGTQVGLLEGPVPGGNGDPWFRVQTGEATGWVDGIYLVPAAAPVAPPAAAPTPPPVPPPGLPASLEAGGSASVVGTAPADGLRLRAEPAPWETLLLVIPEGSRVQIVRGPVPGGNGNAWYRVTVSGAEGWVDGDYLVPAGAAGTAPSSATERGQALVRVALAQAGKKYVFGATGPDAFDCSGLVQYVARAALGIDLPRVAADQALAGVHIAAANLAPGDLVFYANTYQPGISHVGVYIGGGRWVTAEDERTGVVVLSMDAPYWKTRYVGARRIT